MRDVLGFIKDLRQKGIDANQLDYLQSAYEFQQRTQGQLKESNAALHESNDLLKEKINRFENVGSAVPSLTVNFEKY